MANPGPHRSAPRVTPSAFARGDSFNLSPTPDTPTTANKQKDKPPSFSEAESPTLAGSTLELPAFRPAGFSLPRSSAAARSHKLLPAALALRKMRETLQVPIAKATFYRWIHNYTLPALRVGKKLYILQSTLNNAITLCISGEDITSVEVA